MKLLPAIIAIALVLAAVGVYAMTDMRSPVLQNLTSQSTSGSAQTSSTLNYESPKVGESFPYSCAKPAVSSELLCDQLPPGYVILPRQPNAPQPPRLANMSDSAFALIQKTYGNGVCDPNETWLTSPLDCGVPAALVADPYTGRAGSPAVVCQLGNAPQA